MRKHNGIISVWKFIFVFAIVLRHSSKFATKGVVPLFKGGSIFVEFFFLVSGFLMAKSFFEKKPISSNIITSTWKFLWRKITQLFPYVFFSFLLTSSILIIVTSTTTYQWATKIWELLFLKMTGFRMAGSNVVAWYISAMLIAMMVSYPLLWKYKKVYSQLIAPILVILLSGYMSHEYPNLANLSEWTVFGYLGTLRAFLEINMGIISYEICKKLKNVNFTKLGRLLLTIIEIGLFSFMLFAANYSKFHVLSIDYIYLFLFFIAITIAFSELTLTYKFCCNKCFYYLEKISLPLYLNQFFFIYIIRYIDYFKSYSYYEKTFIYVIANLLFAIITIYIVNFLLKCYQKVIKIVKSKLIVS